MPGFLEAAHHVAIGDRVFFDRAYLPDNYAAALGDREIRITGRDVAGWTLDGYVIPRLASGLIFASEVSEEA